MAHELAVKTTSLRFSYLCTSWIVEGDDWEQHCLGLLSSPLKRCGSIWYCNTLIRPAFCIFCWQSEALSPSHRMRHWDRDVDTIRHMDEDHSTPWNCRQCGLWLNTRTSAYHHFQAAHGYHFRS